MKVLMLASGANPHVEKWANSLSENGIDIYLVSLHEFTCKFNSSVKCIKLKGKPGAGYLFSLFELKKLIKEIKPDLLNSHYASGYGTLASLTGFKKILLSLWGSDILIFPKKSIFHKTLIQYNLSKAAGVTSTSICMLNEANKLFNIKRTFITPFGIDLELFKPVNKSVCRNVSSITIGTVKSLENVYGIDILLHAFANLYNKFLGSINLKLVIIGGGSEYDYLLKLALELGINDNVCFKGKVDTNLVPEYLHSMDIFCSFSRSESFGVSALEASSCGIPVVTSDAVGFTETVIQGKTGYRVPIDNMDNIVAVLSGLILDCNKREILGNEGRNFVESEYEINNCIKQMVYSYNEIGLIRK